ANRAPNEQTKEKILDRVKQLAKKYDFKVISVSQVLDKEIILGAIVLEITDKTTTNCRGSGKA
ncbi:MAG: hypothetical protein FGF47_04070, partial [Candidatus Brockarchaeota archaeon]|nr:hypothetical protein [Candidatus Brockarchaeota archaeon]